MVNINSFLNKVLPFVSKPARYIGEEYNSVLKDPEEKLRIALVFPDVYEIGMSNYGLEILYHILNSLDFVWAERAYLPWPDMIEKMKKYGIPLFTLESKTPLNELDAVGISLEYELSYTNVVEVLKLSNIPVRAGERGEADPVIIGGGPLSANPEPISQVFDAILVGDGEEAIIEIAEILKETKGETRKWKIKELSKIKGMYIPAYYEQVGRKIIPVKSNAPVPVKRRVLEDISKFPPPVKKILPHIESVHDRAVIEVMRGCTRGCRYCHAGMIYRPVRERDPKEVIKYAKELIDNTGYEELSLLSLSTMDYTSINKLSEVLINEVLKERMVALSLPSTRVDSFGIEIASRIAGIRKTGLTFAPETASQSLRNVINKTISNENIYKTAETALKAGWRRIKLYFMIGLPTETEDDLYSILDMIKKIKKMGFRDVRASVSIFVPKPHTPFQFADQINLDEAYEKTRILAKGKRFARIDVHNPKKSFIEGVLSRSGREMLDVILKVNEFGQIYDEWSEFFSFDKWLKAFETVGIDPVKYLKGVSFEDDTPWDHIWAGIDKEFLIKEYKKALLQEITPDCRWSRCYLCGICIKEKVRNVLKEFK
ncbi:MAG: TIGR03960 family B12-binding radical SAM protein [Thermotogaceae bacterium]|nr:TIGR03960 family B12-binding radical SAM protein [Thermotogaceae bacterium]